MQVTTAYKTSSHLGDALFEELERRSGLGGEEGEAICHEHCGKPQHSRKAKDSPEVGICVDDSIIRVVPWSLMALTIVETARAQGAVKKSPDVNDMRERVNDKRASV
jgi:hypothetical protein